MALIVLQKLEKPVVDYSMSLQEEITQNGKKTNEEMKEFLQKSSLFQEIEKEANASVNSAIDELQGKHEDKKQENLKNDLVSKRKADLEDVGVLETPNKKRRVDRFKLYNYSDVLNKPINSARENIEGVSDGEFLKHSSDSSYWDEYLPSLYYNDDSETDNETGSDSDEEEEKSHLSKDLSRLIDGSIHEFLDYLRAKCTTLEDIYIEIHRIKNLNILRYNYQLTYYTEIIKLQFEVLGKELPDVE